MKILVCGSRDWNDYPTLVREVEKHNPTKIIHGDAPGADQLAWDVARQLELPCRAYPAQWTKYGRSAGPKRNQHMLDEEKPDLVLAFPLPQSKGTWDMVRRARKQGFKVIVHGEVPTSPTSP